MLIFTIPVVAAVAIAIALAAEQSGKEKRGKDTAPDAQVFFTFGKK